MKQFWLSVRTILRFKTYTAINVAGLALSLACVFVLVRYIHQERNVNRFIPELERTFLTTLSAKEGSKPVVSDSEDPNHDPNYRNPLDHPEVEAFSRFMLREDYVVSGGYRYQMHTLVADSLFFRLIPYPCAEGTLELEPDEALLTREAAVRLFGDESPIGKPLTTSAGRYVTVTGVVDTPSTKSSFAFDLVLSKSLLDRWSYVFQEVVRLHHASDVDKVNRLNAKPMALRMYMNQPVTFQLFPLADYYLSDKVAGPASGLLLRGGADMLRLLTLVAGLLLLVGVSNYVNLYTVVMLKRGRELGVKKVFGAGRGRIFCQLYAENVCLNAFVLLLVWALMEATRVPVEQWFEIPVQADLRFDLLLSAAVLFLLPLLTVVPPFWRYLHAPSMRSLSQVSVGGKAIRTRMAFLLLQYVITFCLMVAAVYLTRHLHYLLHTPVGYRTEGIVECRFWTDNPGYTADYQVYRQEKNKWKGIFALIEKRVKESPLFMGMAYGEPPYQPYHTEEFRTGDGESASVHCLYTNREYMDFFGFRVVEGRGWGEEDVFTQYKMIVNRAFLHALHIDGWRTAPVTPENRLWWSMGETAEVVPYEIVGVMEDFRIGHLSGGNTPVAFVFNDVDKREACYVSIVPGKEKEAVAFLHALYDEAVGAGDFQCAFLKDKIAALHSQDRKMTRIVVTFALIAIGISCLGLFGLSLYDIRLRYREIALRKVNGAQPRDLYRLLLRKYFRLLCVAFVAGSALAYAGISRYMEQFVHKAPLSAWIFLTAGAAVAAIALLTLFWQIRRATRINPAEVMKSE